MEVLTELPGKKTPETEYTKTKKSSPSAPVIETPVPPQVMDPSAPPALNERKPSTASGKHEKESKTSGKGR